MTLRPYQEKLLTDLAAAFERKRRVVAVMPVGAGKTRTAVEFAKRHGGRVLWLAHRIELVQQAVDAFAGYPVTVSTVQSDPDSPADLVIWDECFPSSVMVDGVSIADVSAGSTVTCFDHEFGSVRRATVLSTFKKRPSSLVKLTFNDGSSIVCTPEHPFFTGEKYEKAVDSKSRFVQRLRIHDGTEEAGRKDPQDLLDGVQGNNFGADNGRHESKMRVGSNAKEQSNAQSGNTRQDERVSQENWTQAEVARWKRERSYEASEDVVQSTVESGPGDGASGSDRELEGQRRTFESLQDRYSDRKLEDSYRSRWVQPLCVEQESSGRKEDGIFEFVRVDCVEVLEPGSDGTFGGMCPDGYVYNIEVENHHNYFANGILVHNCHRCAAESYARIQNRYPNADHLGLTATPERSDGVGLRDAFDEMVVGPSIEELIAMGHLVNPRILAPRSKSSSLAMPEIEAWTKHCTGRQGFVFTKTVEQSRRVANELRNINVTAAHVDGETPAAERAKYVDEFKRGALQVLTNCGIFTEGFDAPQASAIVLARAPSHQGLYLQIVGRIMRTAPGKTDALFLDLCGVTNELGAPDAERFYSLDGISRKSPDEVLREGRLCPVCSRQNEVTTTLCTRCGFDFTIADPEVRRRTIQELRSSRTTDDQKLSYLRAQLAIARQRGWSEGSVWHRYKGKFGEPPPSNWRSIR